MTAADMVVTDLDGTVVEGSLRPVIRSRDAPRAVSRVHRDRRRGAHALALRHGVGAVAARDPVPRHHARRLLPRRRAAHGRAQRTRRSRRSTSGTPASRSCGGSRTWTRWRCPRCSSRATRVSCGGPTVSDAVETADILEEVARMAYHALTLDPGGEADQRRAARPALPAQARRAGDVRAATLQPASKHG